MSASTSDLIARVVELYAGTSRFARGFVGGKLRTDPATAAILALATRAGGFGVVADLGCGRGQIGLALLVAGLAERVTGLDLDPVKIADAKRAAGALAAAGGPPADFAVADISAAIIEPCDTVLIFDVLLQMPDAAQYALIGRMAAAARRRVLIRAFDRDRGWRSRVGIAMERIGCVVRRDGSSFRPLALAEIAAPLKAAGFAVSVAPCWGWTPLPNVMLVAERE